MSTTTLTAPLAQVDEIILANGLTVETGSSLRAAFEPMFTQAEEWRIKAESIKVTDISQTRDMKLARECRLALREIRINVESKRKGLKEDSLRKGKAIDGLANIAKFLIEPIEEYLLEQEKFAERQAERERSERLDRRHSEIQPFYEFTGSVVGLADMSDDQFNMLLDGAKSAKARKEEEARRAEEERVAAEKAEAEERERIKLENERLRREAEEAHVKAEAERALREATRIKAEEEAKAAQAKLDAERRTAEEKARKEREAAEAALKAERDKAEKLRQEALAKAAEEQRIASAKAEAERKAAELKLAQERAAREKLEREAAEREAAEAAKRKADEAAAKKAARAPEADKLRAFAGDVRKLAVPAVTSEEGRKVASDIAAKVESFAKWIEAQAATL